MQYILDSCVLIDIFKADTRILDILPELGPPHFLNAMCEEVPVLKMEDPQGIRLAYVEADFEDIEFANAEEGNSPLSWHDLLCMKTAARRQWRLITNDGALHKRCREENVTANYGFFLIFELVRNGFLSREWGKEFVDSVCRINPRMSGEVRKAAFERLETL